MTDVDLTIRLERGDVARWRVDELFRRRLLTGNWAAVERRGNRLTVLRVVGPGLVELYEVRGRRLVRASTGD